MITRTQLKAGGFTQNHNEALRVRSTVKAAGWTANHNESFESVLAERIGLSPIG